MTGPERDLLSRARRGEALELQGWAIRSSIRRGYRLAPVGA